MIITIGRQLGSGGGQIGKTLAEELRCPFFDKELITITAKQSGMCCEILEQRDEHVPSVYGGSFFGASIPFLSSGVFGGQGGLSEQLFMIQSEIILQLAKEHSTAVFVGRCADYILRDHPNCLHLFVSAPHHDRVKRICSYGKVTEKEAPDYMQKTDRQRANYYNFYTSKEWGLAASYDLCINSSWLGIGGTVQTIKQLVNNKEALL